MTSSKPVNIDEYIAGFPKETQALLEEIRSIIKVTAPGAEETISYDMPTFKLNGSYLVYFGGYKNHVSVYPVPREHEAFKEELSHYKGSKGTVQFPLNKPLPIDLIKRIVDFSIQTNKARQAKK